MTQVLRYRWLRWGLAGVLIIIAFSIKASASNPIKQDQSNWASSNQDNSQASGTHPGVLGILSPTLLRDINGDGVINSLDLRTVAAALGTSVPTAEVHGDQTVDIMDLAAVARAFGKIATNATTGVVDTRPPNAPAPLSPANGTSTTDWRLTFEWSGVQDIGSARPVTYELQADNNVKFGSPEIDAPGDGPARSVARRNNCCS